MNIDQTTPPAFSFFTQDLNTEINDQSDIDVNNLQNSDGVFILDINQSQKISTPPAFSFSPQQLITEINEQTDIDEHCYFEQFSK